MRAAILVGGEGKRLRPLTEANPKPLVAVGGRPIIDWQLEWLARSGIDSFVILTGHLKERLIEHLDRKMHKVDIEFVMESRPMGTGGALRNAERALRRDEKFLVINGDVITNIKPSRLTLHGDEIASMALAPLRSTYGVIDVAGSRIRGFREKPLLEHYWMNAGVYLMSNKIFRMLPERGNMESTLFPRLARQKRLRGMKFGNVYWRSIDSLKDIEEVGRDLEMRRVYR